MKLPTAPVTALSTFATLSLLALGCGSDPVPPPATAADPAAAATTAKAAPPPRNDTATDTSGSVHIDDRITKACGNLPTAHFDFDSAGVTGDAAAALGALAQCFSTGPLKGRGMKLVGHADPRGETGYNFGLGQKRAGSVAEFLGKKGVEQKQMQPASKGELEATGTDEEGWARDRKVEILLAD